MLSSSISLTNKCLIKLWSFCSIRHMVRVVSFFNCVNWASPTFWIWVSDLLCICYVVECIFASKTFASIYTFIPCIMILSIGATSCWITGARIKRRLIIIMLSNQCGCTNNFICNIGKRKMKRGDGLGRLVKIDGVRTQLKLLSLVLVLQVFNSLYRMDLRDVEEVSAH
jgi:hypothetical protein